VTQPLQKATGQVQQTVQSLLNYLIRP
jgi:hypothetical protein